ncbi:MAG: HAD-IIA family hydrolase [Lentisphaerota bacterium]
MIKNILDHDLFIFDLDGVVYEGTRALINSIESLCKLHKMGKQIAFFTNNATQTPENFALKVSSMGYKCDKNQIFTSALVCGNALSLKYPKGSKAFVIGEMGLISALSNGGFTIINEDYSFDQIIENETIVSSVVAVGLDKNVSYKKFAAASQLIARGAHFYASNADATLPDVHGFLPGAGSLVSFMITATGKEPCHIFGKPDPEGIFQILKRFNITKDKAVMIGDRIDTDILCGKNAGIKTALALTGVMTAASLVDTPPSNFPDWVLPDLSAIFN